MSPKTGSQPEVIILRPRHEATIDRVPHCFISQLQIAVANSAHGAVIRLSGRLGKPHRDRPCPCFSKLGKKHSFDASLRAGDVFEDARPGSTREFDGLQNDVARPGALQEEQKVVVVAVQSAEPTQGEARKEFTGGCGFEEAHWEPVVVPSHV
jgi:hypothetical protein